ncbi:MAG TPA: hypothetical protein VGK27_10630 [Candidatus Deferrimicrobiaceae bacterium]|jgi:hypothetical protein
MSADISTDNVRITEGRYGTRFLVKLAITVAGGLTLVFGSLYLLFSRPLRGGYGSAYQALNSLTEPWLLLPIVGLPVLVYALVVCIVTVVLCVYAIHKVAGPLYRMDRVVDNYVSGEPIRAVFFRQGDQAAVLADVFNAFVARLREDRQGCQDLMARAESDFARDPAAARAEMAKAAAEIGKRTAKYK